MENNNIKQGVTYGIIGGLIFLVLSFGLWAVGSVENYVAVTGVTTFIPYLFIILLVVGFKLRKDNGGLYSFKDALQFTFVAYVVFAVMEAVGNYVLFAIVDPDMTAKVLEISVTKTLQMMEKFGASEAQIDEAVKRIQAEPKVTSFKQVFLGLGMSLVFNFVKALILSVIVKKNEEVPEQI
jgi:hypothetical protein